MSTVMDVEGWKTWKAAGGRRVTFVGMMGQARVHGQLLTVSRSGLRVRLESGAVEVFHPEDVRPGTL